MNRLRKNLKRIWNGEREELKLTDGVDIKRLIEPCQGRNAVVYDPNN